MLTGLKEWIEGLFRPIFRVTTDGQTYIDRTPTAQDIGIYKNIRMGRSEIITLPNLTTTYSAFLNNTTDEYWLFTHMSCITANVVQSWYELNDTATSVYGHNVAGTASIGQQSCIYGAVGAGMPIVVRPGERVRWGFYNAVGAPVTVYVTYRYAQVRI